MSKKVLLALLAAVIPAAGIAAIMNSGKRESAIAPVKGQIPKGGLFTDRRGNGIHGGLDIAIPVGTPIKAPLSGVVENVYYEPRGGLQIIIRHGENHTGYAHLHKALVTKGQQVKQGQVFALSGNTGQSTGPHLHFTLRIKGMLVDPARYFKFS